MRNRCKCFHIMVVDDEACHLVDLVGDEMIDEEFLEANFVGEKREISMETQSLWKTVNKDLDNDDVWYTDWLTPNLAHALRHKEWFFRKPSVARPDSRDTNPERTV